jgi:hypothetical protein
MIYYIERQVDGVSTVFEGLFFASRLSAQSALHRIFTNNEYEDWSGFELCGDGNALSSASESLEIVEAVVHD